MPLRRRRVSRGTRLARTVACVSIVAAGAIVIAATRSTPRTSASSSTTTTACPPTTGLPAPPTTLPPRYREVAVLTLGHAVADPAAGALGERVLFAGGLDASSTSTARVG